MKFSEKEIFIGVIFLIIIISLLLYIFWANPENVKFCGDGKCSKGESSFCKIDCDWCGDGYCQVKEDCSSCSEDCGNCGGASFCGDGICNIGECASACWKDCSYNVCENGICEEEKGENCVDFVNDCKCLDGYCNEESKQCVYKSCGNNVCDNYESYLSCPNDCEGVEYKQKDNSDINYPIIFVHGHSIFEKDNIEYSINAFKDFQNELSLDSIYQNKGILLPSAKKSSLDYGSWGKSSLPISVRTTYYLGVYDSRGDIVGTEDEQSIIEYGKRLKIVVDTVKYYTGKNKVIIIAHSMGGLVSRSYIKNDGGENNVFALITIGTPNHGVDGKESQYNTGGVGILNLIFGLPKGCNIAHGGEECGEMWHQSDFILSLNQGDETPGNIKYYSIIGDCCKGTDGTSDDEAVSVDSSRLEGAQNIIIKGNEKSGTSTFHQALVHPSQVQEAYKEIIKILQSS